MPTLDWNKKVWNRDYAWPKDGEEWDEFAMACGVPYEKWRNSLAETFLFANIQPSSNVLEIGPGHGRWSQMIPQRIPSGRLYLVDLSEKCIEFCQRRLAVHANVQYYPNDGRTLPFMLKNKIDFVWSFDTFVHLEEPEAKSYVHELMRVMRSHGMGVIHHVGNATPEQRRNGARSQVDGKKFREILMAAGFFVIRQVDSWGEGCNLKLTGDTMSVFTKP